MIEQAAEMHSGLANGYTLTNLKRVYGIILTPGSDDATAIISWTSSRRNGTQQIKLKADSSGPSAVYTPAIPFPIDADTATVTMTGTSATLELQGVGENVIVYGPSSNLVSRVTVLRESNRALVSRFTGLLETTTNLISRLVALKETSKNLVSRLTVIFGDGTRNLICQFTCIGPRWSNVVSRITVLKPTSTNLVCRMDVQQL